MARTAFVSDIHGNLLALQAVVADAEARGVDAFVNLGDIVSGPMWPAETADYLMSKCWPTIAGNHERQVLTHPDKRLSRADRFAKSALSDAHKAWMAAFPVDLWLSDEVYCTHARPGNDHEYWLESVTPDGLRPASEAEIIARMGDCRAALTFHGHSHLPRMVELFDGRIIVNPGSVGLPAYADDEPFAHAVENGGPDARYCIYDDAAAEVTFHAVAYDHEAAARKAEAEGLDSWGWYLREGLAR